MATNKAAISKAWVIATRVEHVERAVLGEAPPATAPYSWAPQG